MRSTFMSDNLPAPAGPYSHAVSSGGVIVCSGQAGIDKDGSVAAGIADQSRRCFDNVLRAIAEAGGTERDIVQVRVYLSEREHFGAMNAEYEAFFSSPFPARTTVYVGLPTGLLIEVDAIAMTTPSKDR